jgi:hypothetical protein
MTEIENKYIAKRFGTAGNTIKKTSLYKKLVSTYHLPSITSHAASKKNLLELLTTNKRIGCLKKPVSSMDISDISIPVSELHKIASVLFVNRFKRKLFHLEDLGDKEYYLKIIATLNPDRINNIKSGKIEIPEIKLYDNGLKSKDVTERKTFFFNLKVKRSSKQQDILTTKLCDKLNKTNPQIYRKEQTLNKADSLILKKIKKCYTKFIAHFDKIEKTKNIFDDKKKTFCTELQAILETSKDTVLKGRVETILHNVEVLKPDKNINHVFDYFNIKGDFRKIIKNLLVNKKDIKMDMKKQLSIIKLNDKYMLEYKKIERLIDENIKIINIIGLFNCIHENIDFVFDCEIMPLISPSLITVSKNIISLVIEKINDINAKNALTLQLIFLNTVEYIRELYFVKTIASLLITGGLDIIKTTTSSIEIFKIFHFKNMDIRKYESYMFNYYLENVAKQDNPKNTIDILSGFVYNITSLNYFCYVYTYIDFDSIDEVLLEKLMFLVAKDDGKQIGHENFIDIFLYIIEKKRPDLSKSVKSHVKKNITKNNIFYVFDILKKKVTDTNKITQALKTVEKAENWVKILSSVIDCSDNILFVCFILRPTTRIINKIKEIKSEDKFCVEQYIATLILVYVISKYFLPDSYLFFSLKDLLLKISFETKLSILCGHILHDLADFVFFRYLNLDIIYEKYNEIYAQYPKKLEDNDKYKNVVLFPIEKFDVNSDDYKLCLVLNKYKKINDCFCKDMGLPYVEPKTKNEKDMKNSIFNIFGKYEETIQILRLKYFRNRTNNNVIDYTSKSPEIDSGKEFKTPKSNLVD